MYCAGRLGRNTAEYREAYEVLKDVYSGIGQYSKVGLPAWIDAKIRPYFDEIEEVLAKPRLLESDIQRIANIAATIEKIENSGSNGFRDLALNWRLEDDLKHNYPPGLYAAVESSFRGEDYDGVMVAAFNT